MENKRIKLENSDETGDQSGKEKLPQNVADDFFVKMSDDSAADEARKFNPPTNDAYDRVKKDSKPDKASEEEAKEPIPGRCQFFLKRKKRFCKTLPGKDKPYCVEHSHLLGESNDRKRIPCPLDPKHTCYEDSLKKHLKKCNSRPDLQPVFYDKGINSGESDIPEPEYKVGIRDISDSEVLQFVEKVRELHKAHTDPLETDILFHPVLRSAADDPKNGAAALKHIHQVASLVGHVGTSGLLRDNTTFIEFGAGKGGLSHWVQLAAKENSDTQFLLIDRSSVRYKMDSYHRGEDQGPSFERIKIDIGNMNLSKIESIKTGSGKIVGVGKHLCGAATDLMLRCLVKTLKNKEKEASLAKTLGGIVLALCCHHRCDWRAYVGKDFMSQIGISPREFHLLVSMSSWATCGTRPTSSGEDDKDEHAENAEAKAEYNHPRYGSLRPEERELLGYQCKQLIDTGRVRYLKKAGLLTRHVNFTERKYSLENMAIIATNL